MSRKIHKKTTSASNRLRIIGGQWRGRKLRFTDGEGLRPTLDRVRETLFNWLQYDLAGARCLDLFAGSGALGLEALSRYAGEVIMVDSSSAATACIQENLTLLSAENACLLNMEARDYLKQEWARPFDIVFLDPPFNRQLLTPCIDLLNSNPWLRKGSLIYLEVEKNAGRPAIPDNWDMLKEKTAGQLAYYLAITR